MAAVSTVNFTVGMTQNEMVYAIDEALDNAGASFGNPSHSLGYNSNKLDNFTFSNGERAKIDFTSMVKDNGSVAGVNVVGPRAGSWNGDVFTLDGSIFDLGSDNRRASNGSLSFSYGAPSTHVPVQEPTITTTAIANDTLTLNAAALTAGFTLTLETGVTVTAAAGETTQQLADKINAGTGTATAGGFAPASHNGHGYTATVSGDVITLTAAGAITGGAGDDGAPSGTSEAAGDGTLDGVAVSVASMATISTVNFTAGQTQSEMTIAIATALANSGSSVSAPTQYYLNFSGGERAKIDFTTSYEASGVTLAEAATAAAAVAATAAQDAATATAASNAAAATAEAANAAAAETDAALANAGSPAAQAAALQAAATAEAANEAANEAIAASTAAQAAAENAHQAEIEAIAAAADGSGTDAKVNALSAIKTIDAAIQTVNIQRSKLGAVSNRLSHTINNLTNISSNLSAAQGGIEDADFAKETTDLAKNQILQQASTAMLAQANASKQNVLSLLQG
jgi:flagellin